MASNITLSAGVRQNLLSLQSTAALMATTQGRLATGKKVNSALDNPTNFFTSQSLSTRASDLNSLLDLIGQAQKTLEAADKGLTSLTKMVESAKSIAKQARQAPQPGAAGYSAIILWRQNPSLGIVILANSGKCKRINRLAVRLMEVAVGGSPASPIRRPSCWASRSATRRCSPGPASAGPVTSAHRWPTTRSTVATAP